MDIILQQNPLLFIYYLLPFVHSCFKHWPQRCCEITPGSSAPVGGLWLSGCWLSRLVYVRLLLKMFRSFNMLSGATAPLDVGSDSSGCLFGVLCPTIPGKRCCLRGPTSDKWMKTVKCFEFNFRIFYGRSLVLRVSIQEFWGLSLNLFPLTDFLPNLNSSGWEFR